MHIENQVYAASIKIKKVVVLQSLLIPISGICSPAGTIIIRDRGLSIRLANKEEW
jgi:hypothetical protein